MNHLPYKDWLLAEEPLPAEQSEDLQDHLRTCEPCRQIESAWTDVNALIQKTPAVDPLSGFAMRWQTRLVAHRLKKQRQLAWIIVGLCSGIAVTLAALFGTQLLEILQSPGHLILVWISRVSGILSIYWGIQNMVSTIAAQVPSISWLVVIFGIGFVSFLSVLWLAAYRQLTFMRRVV